MKYIKLFENFKSHKGGYIEGLKLGDKVLQDSDRNMYPLPSSQVPTDDGLYTLMFVPINKIDLFGTDRSDFDEDDEDGFQTETLDYMLKNFDTLPPTIWEEKSDGTYGHIDGHHRIVIAQELGRNELLAFVKEINQTGDYVNKPPKPKKK